MQYRADGSALLAELEQRSLLNIFDFGGSAGYSDMLRDQVAGRNDSWAVRWYASALLNGMYTLYPGRSLVANIGSDGSGSHGAVSSAFDVEVSHDPVPAMRVPIEDFALGRQAFQEFFDFQRSGAERSPIGRKVRKWLRPLWIRTSPGLRHAVTRQIRP